MNREQELEQTIGEARDELCAIRSKREIEQNRPYVGKCFRYRNCYSCPEKPEDYWWLYVKVTGIDEDDGELKGWGFQIDSRGRIEIRPKEWIVAGREGYEEIHPEQFNLEYSKLIDKVTQYE